VPQLQSTAAWLGQVIPGTVPASLRDRLHPKELLDKIHPQEMIDKIHSSKIVDQLHDLSKQHQAPMSAASSAQAILGTSPSRPAPATSVPDDNQTH
jgi:hypothetical protein